MPLPPNRPLARRWFLLITIGVLVVTAAIYWPGLHGPFLLDDNANLGPVFDWLKGWYSASYVIFGNSSGLFGRPLSMASFWLDTALFRSTASFPYKATNLGIHLACGLALLWLAWQILRRALRKRGSECLFHAGQSYDQPMSVEKGTLIPFWPPFWAALAVMIWWLWLPLNVDTVLYTVQRMAQLAALFMLLGLAVFMLARRRIDQGRASGWWLLWVAVPALTVLAALSKENGVLVTSLALVLELFLFRRGEHARGVKWFFGVTVALPIAVGIAYLIYRPGFIMGGYADRPFTLAERLMTEPRVMWSYVQTLLVPIGPRMGFFQDNFPLSTSLLHPWTTLPAIIAWLAAIVLGWRWRKANPLFGLGVWCYLVGQALESGPIALEIYFEHRNYLPSFGVLLAVVGTVIWAWRQLPAPTVAFRRLAVGLSALVLALFGLATWGHVQSWRNVNTFYSAQSVFNPTSPRLHMALASHALSAGDLQVALRNIAISERHSAPTHRAFAPLLRLNAYCKSHASPPAMLYAQLGRYAGDPISPFAMKVFGVLAGDVQDCPGLDVPRLTGIMLRWLRETPSSPRSRVSWATRYNLARMVAQSGDLTLALTIVHKAWVDSGYNNVLAVLLFQLNGSLGDVDACRAILKRMVPAYGHGNHRIDQAIVTFRKALADGSIHPPAPAPASSSAAPSAPPPTSILSADARH